MPYEPGEEFFYNSGVSLVLSAIFEKITRTDVASYGREHLFQPMAITDFCWKKTPQSVSDGQEGLYITGSDLAKLGQLMLNGGLWNKRQLVSPDWMSKMTQPYTEGGEGSKPGYDFQWWFSRLGNDSSSMLMASRGYGGQLLLIDREHYTWWFLPAGTSTSKGYRVVCTKSLFYRHWKTKTQTHTKTKSCKCRW
jgi:CubicO group peptidase (beta-lactamase class C family)